MPQVHVWRSVTKPSLVDVSLSAKTPIAKMMFPKVAVEAVKPNSWDFGKNATLGHDAGIVFDAAFDRRGINETLHQLGCEVSLQWSAKKCGLDSFYWEKDVSVWNNAPGN